MTPARCSWEAHDAWWSDTKASHKCGDPGWSAHIEECCMAWTMAACTSTGMADLTILAMSSSSDSGNGRTMDRSILGNALTTSIKTRAKHVRRICAIPASERRYKWAKSVEPPLSPEANWVYIRQPLLVRGDQAVRIEFESSSNLLRSSI